MELKPCKMATAVSLIVMLLLLTIGGQGDPTGDECSAISRSTTFQGDCHSRDLCVATCRSEGHAAGYCFRDVADPDHRVCMCTAPCPPEPVTTMTTSRGNMV
ncbi:unnamed protein product [Miscanthus lutarioriparius]|uniref:Knottins-like domain-containing protein n=1 Tax=Miscanthus lutarioriparius TaxID=422564 RepID=A0A811PX22_9POAL|nr:unnamed protein product [Miscanthus lutarioriparius]